MVVLALVGGPCYQPPVHEPVAVPFVLPQCTYCPGHRGVEYQLDAAVAVTAVADGTVTFAGVVAGTRYVVVLHRDGLKATYGLLSSVELAKGDVVRRGEVVGRSSLRLYFGLRDAADRPIDPTPLLGRWVGRPRLVPTDGRPPRPGPPPRLACGVQVSGADAV
jgi:hypothetical protein